MLQEQVQWAAVRDKIQDLKAPASELFIGKIEVELEIDPEIPNCNYAVFHVTTSCERSEIPALRREWYHRTIKLLKTDCDQVRLVISVEE